MNRKMLVSSAAIALFAGIGATACTASDTTAPPPPTAQQQESNAQQQDSNNLITNQPVPIYDHSQMRQTLINVQDIQANGENTTSFFFNQGVQDPIMVCSSVGMPVASDTQLTNPSQQVKQPDGGGYQLNNGDNVLEQPDPTGVYTGPSSGTNVLCVNNKGQQYIQYWEGFVDTVSAGAKWDTTTHQVTLLGSLVPLKK